MSRSEQAQALSFSKLSACAAIGCVLALGNACRFSTNSGAGIVDTDAGTDRTSRAGDEAPPSVPTSTTTGAATAPALDAAIAPNDQAADASSAGADTAAVGDAGMDVDASISAARDAGSTLQQPPMAAARPDAGSSAGAPATSDAGAAPAPDAGSSAGAPATSDAGAAPAKPRQSLSDMQCSAELASCLLRDPLGYAECLRMNEENHCPLPDSGVPTMSPVTSEDGTPLSQACQAELATCIMRLPTPENAASCTEKARKCK